jgi:hypothetical protein
LEKIGRRRSYLILGTTLEFSQRGVDKYLRIFGVRRWNTKAQDRNPWRRPRPTQGCNASKEEEEEDKMPRLFPLKFSRTRLS